ncbi:MAG TPA: DNA primase [Pirellulaceae bacterium]|nr:DNA primase [Pirellulaceae bacterium]
MLPGNDIDVKDRVKQATDIVQLIGSYLQLRRQGAMFVASCPWHDDRRPSLQVHPQKQIWKCWVCGIGGDVFNFVMRREGVEFREALTILADRLGIALQAGGSKARPGSPEDKQALYKAMAWAAKQYRWALDRGDGASLARQYLADRKIASEIADRFQIGFAPLEWSWLVDRARSTEFSPEVLEACGLIVRRENGGWTERFRGRLLFPIHDTMGRVIAFGGRIVPGVFPAGQEPQGKYINSPESRLFSKSETLYGLHLAADAAGRSRHLTVVEGYTDVIGAYQAGLRDVVAVLGTAINQRHIRLLRRYADCVTLVLDGDAAGQKRTSEVLDLFVAETVDLRIMSLPQGQDPFDFFQTRGADEFLHLVSAAPDALEHRLQSELSGLDVLRDTHRANQALERVLVTLAQVPTSLSATTAAARLRFDQMLVRLARRFQLDRDTLHNRLQEIRRQRASIAVVETAGVDESGSAYSGVAFPAHEAELLQLGLLDALHLDLIIEQIAPAEFSCSPLQQIYQSICDGFVNQQDVSFEGLMLLLEDTELKRILVWLYDEAEKKQQAAGWDTRAQLDSVLAIFRDRREQADKRQIVMSLEDGTLDQEQEVLALAELLDAARRRTGV